MKDRIIKDLKWIKVDSSPYYWALSPKSKPTKLHKGNNRLNSTQNSQLITQNSKT